jgi:UDP-N-acetylglucosamine--N-acetylmuramyl-(pentapeptide) pyrophosphoryl-undecaprenol N-acetylglucosamine transferase
MSKIVLLVGGGTKGHLFPAVSIAESLIKDSKITPVIITDIKDEKTISNFKTIIIPRMPLTSGVIKKALFCLIAFFTLIRLVYKYLKLQPSLIIGFGGFTTFIPLLAAKLLKIPIFIHEQNSVLGKANEFMARYADKIFLGFFDALIPPTEHAHKCILIQNPIRKEIRKSKPKSNFDGKIFSILVIGGSQGAKAFDQIIPNAIAKVKKMHSEITLKIAQQAHESQHTQIRKFYDEIKVECKLQQFFENMQNEYENANLVICRAGASTIGELVAICKPAILIPLPHAAKNHQYLNARYLQNLKCAWIVKQDKECSEKLALQISDILQNPKTLTNVSSKLFILQSKNQGLELTDFVNL